MRIVRFATFAACLVLAACSPGPESVTKAFLQETTAGQTAEALERIDPEMKQVGGMFIAAALGNQAAKAKRKGGAKAIKVFETKIVDDTHAVVRTETHFGDGSTAREENKVRKVEGKWYITM